MQRLLHRRLGRGLVLLAATVSASLALAAPAGAHGVGVHWVTLTPGTSSSVRSTTFTGHSGFQLEVTAHFGQVTNGSAFLDYVDFRVYNIQVMGISGGQAYVWNSATQLTYEADRAETYYSAATYRLNVSRWFIGGQGNGQASVTIEKDNVAWAGTDAVGHRSPVTFYVP
jgi:hypothetical protein